MRDLKVAGVILATLCSAVIMSTSASAFVLPDVALTLSGTYPIHMQGSRSVTFFWSTAAGNFAQGSGVTLLLLSTALSGLGTFTYTFTSFTAFGSRDCRTFGLVFGVVVISGEYHVVPLNTTGSVGLLFLVPKTTIECEGPNEIVLQGSAISSISAGTENQELTSVGGKLEGSKGKSTISEFINDTGSKIKAKLEVEINRSGEFLNSAVNINEELILGVLGSKMVVVTGR